jgi:hypothetical protein
MKRAVKVFLASQHDPQAPIVPLYRNQNSNFGAYLISANLLRFKGAELSANGREVDFVFYDPEQRGPELLRRYQAGAAEFVNARTLYEVRGYLIGEIKRLQVGVGDAEKA